MDADRPSFMINLDDLDKPSTPAPATIKLPPREKLELPDFYPKYEAEFLQSIEECMIQIDRLPSVATKIKFNNRLSRAFVTRDRVMIMRLFRDLVNERFKGEPNGRENSSTN